MDFINIIKTVAFGGMSIICILVFCSLFFDTIVRLTYILFPTIFKLQKDEVCEDELDKFSYMEESLNAGWEYMNDDSRYMTSSQLNPEDK